MMSPDSLIPLGYVLALVCILDEVYNSFGLLGQQCQANSQEELHQRQFFCFGGLMWLEYNKRKED
jgi:hypothetical protein